MKGIRVSLFTDQHLRSRRWPGGEHALEGLREVTLVGYREREGDRAGVVPVFGSFEPTPEAPAVIIVRRGGEPYLRLLVEPEGARMFGGVYAASHDARFVEAAGIYGAVSVHDRYERFREYFRE